MSFEFLNAVWTEDYTSVQSNIYDLVEKNDRLFIE